MWTPSKGPETIVSDHLPITLTFHVNPVKATPAVRLNYNHLKKKT